MALHKLASIVVRPRLTWRLAALSAAALTAAGCSHNRQSYRPTLREPARRWSAAVHQLWRFSATVTEDATGGTVSSVPSLVDHAELGLARHVVDRPGHPGKWASPELDRGETSQARLDDEPG